MLNKKGQIAGTITWTVATIIIVVVLTIFFFASNVLGTVKKVEAGVGLLKIKVSELGSSVDFIDVQTKLALDKNELNKEKIVNWINEGRT